jgi:hypothetical protein
MTRFPTTAVRVAWAVTGLLLLGFVIFWVMMLWTQAGTTVP